MRSSPRWAEGLAVGFCAGGLLAAEDFEGSNGTVWPNRLLSFPCSEQPQGTLLPSVRRHPVGLGANTNKKGEVYKTEPHYVVYLTFFSTVLVLYKVCFLVRNMFPCDLINSCSGAVGSYCRNVILSYFTNQIHWPCFLPPKIPLVLCIWKRWATEHGRQQDQSLRNRNDVILNLSKKIG